MGKYDGLRTYLQEQGAEELTLSFRKIESIIGATLPDGALKPHWWSNELSSQSAQTFSWLDARYRATLYAGRKVKFTKLDR
jgi:hypothetical protein